MNASDQELIQQLLSIEASTSDKAWQEVYSSCYPIIADMIRKHNGSEEDAFDIFQDALLILNRNLKNGTFRGEASIRTFLFSVCKNLWLKEFNRKQKQQTAEARLKLNFIRKRILSFLLTLKLSCY